MKKFYIFVISLFTINGLFAQWVPQNSGTNQWLRSVFFTDYNTGYIVGDTGTILKTTNGGDQWFPLISGTNNDLLSVTFITSSTGYSVGKGVILKTEDAGASWINRTPPGLYDGVWLNCVQFPVFDTGYIVGDTTQGWWMAGLILKTVNGGSTWAIDTIIQDTNWLYSSLNSVYFLDANVGFACGGKGGLEWHGYILRTMNGGLDWNCIEAGPGFQSIYFTNDSTGYCIGGYSMSSASQLYKTTDTGSTWIAADFFTFHPRQLFFSDMNTGVIVGSEGNFGHGSVLITNDGGVSWSSPVFIDTNALNSVFFTDRLTGYVVGYGGIIYKTTNGGITTVNELPFSNSTFEMYPNPAQSFLNMEISAPFYFGRATITNIQGQTVQEHSVLSKQMQFDISSLNSGIYFVRLQNEQSIVVKKFIKIDALPPTCR